MKYLIVGLGNIGAQYENTRHNVGFSVLDALAAQCGGTFVSDRYGSVCEIKHKGRTLLLLKPSTYMNLSGNAVRYWMQNQKIEVENIFVIVDDLAIDFGTIRIRKQGSAGGHNGLSHINETLTHQNYARLRFGISGDFPKGFQVDYVLGHWTAEQQRELPELLQRASEAILSFATQGIERTMNTFNTSKKDESR